MKYSENDRGGGDKVVCDPQPTRPGRSSQKSYIPEMIIDATVAVAS